MAEDFSSDYEPTVQDLVWAKMMIEMLHDQGILVYPDSKLVYRVHQNIKVLELIAPQLLELHPGQKDLHARGHNVFEMIGWKVVP